MMRIRCPNCETRHEVPDSVLAGKPRKVRCASCRTVFEAVAESDSPAGSADTGAVAAAIDWSGTDDALIGDTMVTPIAANEDPPEPEADMNAAMGQDDLDALFADAPPEMPPGNPVDLAPEPSPPDNPVASAPEGQEAAMLAATASAAAAGAAATASARAGAKPRKRNPHSKPARSSGFRLKPALGMVAATGIGTLMALTIFRHETVRIAPSLAPYFEMMGLEVNSTGLEIRNVRSHIVIEDHRETLEITGQVFNITRARQMVPVIRLSLHNAEGQQLYVWTGTADATELAAGEKTQFRRKLASPPRDATQVMVRFVARDDIVASIR